MPEGRLERLLVKAQHPQQVPGRKTDVKDCAWIAQLLQHGLLKASRVPPPPPRELRAGTRQRAQLVAEPARGAQRIPEVLGDANIKLASVAADVLGRSGRDMLRALIGGEADPEKLADLARRQLRAKLPTLPLALAGRVTEHHRFLLHLHLEHDEQLEAWVGQLGGRIGEQLAPFAEAPELLTTIPGIQQRTAEVLRAEIGTSREPFPTAAQLASWAGGCPGNNESAGKRRSGKTRKGSRWLRGTLLQAAWAASRTKATYPASHFRRRAGRRGAKRAAVAVSHTLLGIVYQVLKRRVPYQDLGADYLDRRQPDRLTRQLVKRLERLGHKVILEPQEAA